MNFPNFDSMKQKYSKTRSQASKGDRLGWTPLKNVSSVKLSSELTRGKLLTSNDLTHIGKPNSGTKNLFVR